MPIRPCQESISPRLPGKRSRANKQTSIGLYHPLPGLAAVELAAAALAAATDLFPLPPSAASFRRVWLR